MPSTPFLSRVYRRLTADRGPGKKKLWVILGIICAALSGVVACVLAVAYIAFAKGLPSIDWARRYRPPPCHSAGYAADKLRGIFDRSDCLESSRRILAGGAARHVISRRRVGGRTPTTG